MYKRVKEAQEYWKYIEEKELRYVNIEVLLAFLVNEQQVGRVSIFFDRPKEKVLIDPVVDPQESYASMIKRILNFEDPPLVERSSLARDQQPQYRFWGVVRQYINGLEVKPVKVEKEERKEVGSEYQIKEFEEYKL